MEPFVPVEPLDLKDARHVQAKNDNQGSGDISEVFPVMIGQLRDFSGACTQDYENQGESRDEQEGVQQDGLHEPSFAGLDLVHAGAGNGGDVTGHKR